MAKQTELQKLTLKRWTLESSIEDLQREFESKLALMHDEHATIQTRIDAIHKARGVK